MTRAEKAKAKFTKRNPFGFEHVEASLHRGDRGDRGDRGERSSKEIKKFFAADTVAAMKADIQAIEDASAVIDRDVQAKLTRAGAKAKTKEAAILTTAGAKAKTKEASNDLIVNIDKTAIEVSSDGEFEAFITDEEVMKEAMNMSGRMIQLD